MITLRQVFQSTIGKVSREQCSLNTTKLNYICKMSTSPKKVTIAQMRSTNDKKANMLQVTELVAKTKAEGSKFLFLPECCDFVGENRKQTLEMSEPLTGTTMQQYRELAKRNGIWISLGGIHESILDEEAKATDKIYNAHVVINECGDLVRVYRKLHLFDVDTPEYRFRESDIVMPGERLVTPLDSPIGCIGLQICYDVRFAEASLLLRRAGAQILTYPSAFAFSTGCAHWEVLLRARAIENQCYVIAPAQIGFHNTKRQSWGHAMVVSPWGEVLADCGGEQELAVQTVCIDLSKIETIRNSMPCFTHRRNDIYSLTAYDSIGVPMEPLENRLFDTHVICKDTIFYETPHCFAFTNLRCVVNGHVLVATKRVTPRLKGLHCEEMADLFTAVCRIQRMLEQIYNTAAATVTVQDGPAAGQTVPHVHFHVMSRRPGDFGHNDQIYVKMEEQNEDAPERTLETRIEEAQTYRDFLKNNLL